MISILIPTLDPDEKLFKALDAIKAQDIDEPYEIIIIDSGSSQKTITRLRKREAQVHHTKTFGHGKTRNELARRSKGRILIYLTQDAIPQGKDWLKKMITPLQGKTVGVYARQIPYPEANPMEQHFYATQFPQRKKKKRKTELDKIFFSNAASAMTKDAWKKTPFREDLIMAEDQAWSKDVQRKGLRTTYNPQAIVMHSHDYTIGSVFKRYFDSLVALNDITNDGIADYTRLGLHNFRKEAKHILKTAPHTFPHFLLYVSSRYLGATLGMQHRHLPRRLSKRCSDYPAYWETHK